MQTITEQQFGEAIEAGIAAVNERDGIEFDPAEQVALRDLVGNTPVVGTSFYTTPGCPWMLVFGSCDDVRALCFASAYDCLVAASGIIFAAGVSSIEVV